MRALKSLLVLKNFSAPLVQPEGLLKAIVNVSLFFWWPWYLFFSLYPVVPAWSVSSWLYPAGLLL
ncbi:MAG: hypothetical protein JWR02_424 [Mucilaginibacter sp.]|nr:hypothetical protein [Mucilaginibacter sp.]